MRPKMGPPLWPLTPSRLPLAAEYRQLESRHRGASSFPRAPAASAPPFHSPSLHPFFVSHLAATRPPRWLFPGDPRGSPQKRRYEYLPAGAGDPRVQPGLAGREAVPLLLSLSLPLLHSLSLRHTHTHTHTRTDTRTEHPPRQVSRSCPARLASCFLQTFSLRNTHPANVSSGSRTPLADPYPYSWDGADGASPEPPAAGVTAPYPTAPLPPGPRPKHHGPEGFLRRQTLKMTDAGGKGLGPKIPNVEEDAGSLGLVVGTLVGLDGAKRQGPFFPCPLRGAAPR